MIQMDIDMAMAVFAIYFAHVVDTDDYDLCHIGALAVYGWMPTVMRSFNRNIWEDHRAALSIIRSATTWEEIEAVIDEHPALLRLVNGSAVGTSKFLHFLNPQIVPIWDSKIKRAYGFPQYGQLGPARFKEYGRQIHEAIAEQSENAALDFPISFQEFSGPAASAVRRWEHLLFIYALAHPP
jgi:hypothetical protein